MELEGIAHLNVMINQTVIKRLQPSQLLFILFMIAYSDSNAQFKLITEPRYHQSWHVHFGPDVAFENKAFWDEILSYETNDTYQGTYTFSTLHVRNRHLLGVKAGNSVNWASNDSLRIIHNKWMFELSYGYNLFMWREVIISSYGGIRLSRLGVKSSSSNNQALEDYLTNREVRLSAHPWTINFGLNAVIFDLATSYSAELYVAYSYNINQKLSINEPYGRKLASAKNPMQNLLFGIGVGFWF